MIDSYQSPLQPMSPEEQIIIEKKYKTSKGLLIFFMVFQMIWAVMLIFGVLSDIPALIICFGVFFVLYACLIIYYIRLIKNLRLDLLDKLKLTVSGVISAKQIKPGRSKKFFYLRVNGHFYQVPQWYFEQTDVGNTAELPVSKHTLSVLFPPSG
ncbi:MAG: hypothetical protein HPY53_06240 [Brevinematales bacterium]|nr:hypothetical protein [Brevinematales bacterium]